MQQCFNGFGGLVFFSHIWELAVMFPKNRLKTKQT